MQENQQIFGERLGHHELKGLFRQGGELARIPAHDSHIMSGDGPHHLVEVGHGLEVGEVGRELWVAVPCRFADVLRVLTPCVP